MDHMMLKIRERYNQMSKGDKRISDFVLENHDRLLGMTAADIAQASGVSSASVIRYVKKMGADGLDGFKLELAAFREQEEKKNEWRMADPILSDQDDLEMICRKMQSRADTAYGDFFYQLDTDALKRAVEAVKKARKIYLLGLGSSYSAAYDLFHKLRRAGFDANCYQDLNMVTEFFNYIDHRDVVLAFSYSGQSKEILYSCEKAREQKAKVIVVTRKSDSPIKKLAEICLNVPDLEDVQRVGAFESLQTSLMMGWLIYLGVIREDFRRIEIQLVKTRKLVEGLKEKLE